MFSYMWLGHHDTIKNYKWTTLWGSTLYGIINLFIFVQYKSLSRCKIIFIYNLKHKRDMPLMCSALHLE